MATAIAARLNQALPQPFTKSWWCGALALSTVIAGLAAWGLLAAANAVSDQAAAREHAREERIRLRYETLYTAVIAENPPVGGECPAGQAAREQREDALQEAQAVRLAAQLSADYGVTAVRRLLAAAAALRAADAALARACAP